MMPARLQCITCKFSLGQYRDMELDGSVYHCNVCGSTRIADKIAAPVLTVRSALSRALYIGGFMLLLLASVVFDAFPTLEIPLTWSLLYCLFIAYFGLAYANFRRKLFV